MAQAIRSGAALGATYPSLNVRKAMRPIYEDSNMYDHHDSGEHDLGEHIIEAVIIGSILRSPAGQWLCGCVIGLVILVAVALGTVGASVAINRHFHPEIEAKEKAEAAAYALAERQQAESAELKRRVSVAQYEYETLPHVTTTAAYLAVRDNTEFFYDYTWVQDGVRFKNRSRAYIKGTSEDCFRGWSVEQLDAFFLKNSPPETRTTELKSTPAS
jgi:hypothetical protein